MHRDAVVHDFLARRGGLFVGGKGRLAERELRIMSLMLAKTYAAFKAAGVPESEAQAAAERSR
jgi:hypothetical protein